MIPAFLFPSQPAPRNFLVSFDCKTKAFMASQTNSSPIFFLFLFLFPFLFLPSLSPAQSKDTIIFSHVGSYHYKTDFPFLNHFNTSTFFDRTGKPYVYGAASTLGMSIIDISDPSVPVLDNVISKSNFNNLNVSFLQQRGELLYVSIGDFQSLANAAPGLAIVDVSNPTAPVITDIWTDTSLTEGTAVIRLSGNHAYLGAMEDGVIALDISDSSNIQFASRIVPDPTYPSYNTLTANARGMSIRNDTLFLAYDSGGLRLIDISNPDSMIELGMFVDSTMWFGPPATPVTNHVTVRGKSAFITNDYCGISSIDFSDADSMFTLDWYNPWNCKDTSGPIGQNSSWFGSEGHTNEIAEYLNEVILVSGGDSEVLAIDVGDPGNLRVAGEYIFPGDSEIVWGLDYYNGMVVLAYVRNPWEFPLQPYIGNWGGIKLLDVTLVVGDDSESRNRIGENKYILFPNPSSETITINGNFLQSPDDFISIADLTGKRIPSWKLIAQERNAITLQISELSSGIYFLKFQNGGISETTKFIKFDSN